MRVFVIHARMTPFSRSEKWKHTHLVSNINNFEHLHKIRFVFVFYQINYCTAILDDKDDKHHVQIWELPSSLFGTTLCFADTRFGDWVWRFGDWVWCLPSRWFKQMPDFSDTEFQDCLWWGRKKLFRQRAGSFPLASSSQIEKQAKQAGKSCKKNTIETKI